jgi:uncharacterized protein HemY
MRDDERSSFRSTDGSIPINDWDWASAKRELARAEALESHDLNSRSAAAMLAEVRGNWDAAQRHLDSALTLDPLAANLLYVRGEVMLAGSSTLQQAVQHRR